MRKYKRYLKTADQKYGLTENQVEILDEISDSNIDDLPLLEIVDRLQQLFTRYHFQIGTIGTLASIVQFQPFDVYCFPKDNGKYFITKTGENLTKALKKCIVQIPNMFSHCANLLNAFNVNKNI
jgi:hypothetical protein